MTISRGVLVKVLADQNDQELANILQDRDVTIIRDQLEEWSREENKTFHHTKAKKMLRAFDRYVRKAYGP